METKVPFYNVLNMLLIGLILIVGVCLAFPDLAINLIANDVVVGLSAGGNVILTAFVFAVAYEVGYLINRLGSVVLEELLKKTKLIPYNDDYRKYNEVKKEYPAMDILSREYASSRTNIMLFLIIMLVEAFAKKFILALIAFACVTLFFFSCRKHAKRITTLMNKI